jgi:hypothetical protein
MIITLKKILDESEATSPKIKTAKAIMSPPADANVVQLNPSTSTCHIQPQLHDPENKAKEEDISTDEDDAGVTFEEETSSPSESGCSGEESDSSTGP